MTFGLAAVFFLVALILFALAVFPIPEPYGGRLVPLGLAFVSAGLLVAGTGAGVLSRHSARAREVDDAKPIPDPGPFHLSRAEQRGPAPVRHAGVADWRPARRLRRGHRQPHARDRPIPARL